MLCKSYLLLLLVLFPLFSWAQPVAIGRKTWSIYSSVGMATGMKELATDVQFGLTKSLDKWSIFGELHLNSYPNSNAFRLSAMLGRDLLRLYHLKRHPYFLFAYGGIGITHLRNPIFFDTFLIKGDDMLHLSLGIQPRWMFTKTFGMMADVHFNQNMLIDYQLKRSLNANIGFILKLQ
jgi:hypothetical protein